MRPKLRDYCCCEGGAGAGYYRAGWDVTGNDIYPKFARRYPYRFVAGDGLKDIKKSAKKCAAVHISCPCQWYTRGNAPLRGEATKWERTIPTWRDAAMETGLPYVIENVKDAVWDMKDPILLCGCMFSLSTIDTDGIRIHLERPRLFEINWDFPDDLVVQTIKVKGEEYVVRSPIACDHSRHEWVAGAYGGARRDKYEAKYVRKGGYVPADKCVVQDLLGIDHEMTWNGLFESVPPAYTEYMGRRLMAVAS